MQLAKSLQLKLCAHFHNSLIFLQREFIYGLYSQNTGNSKWSAKHLFFIGCVVAAWKWEGCVCVCYIVQLTFLIVLCCYKLELSHFLDINCYTGSTFLWSLSNVPAVKYYCIGIVHPPGICYLFFSCNSVHIILQKNLEVSSSCF